MTGAKLGEWFGRDLLRDPSGLLGGDEHGIEVPATQALVDHIVRGK
jgi:hypothetical protein